MGIVGIGKVTYLYLNGIRPREEVVLDNGVVLLPSSCKPTPDNIIAKSKSEIDIGVACIFLRSVSACIRITADTSKDLAVKAWNAQWDALILGALYDCEVMSNFQSDVQPEEFPQASIFNVTGYSFRGYNAGYIRKISSKEHKWISNHYRKVARLMDNDRYLNAIHSLSTYKWHSLPRAQLALIWAGIEGLFGVDSELSFRVSLYIARYLSPRKGQRQRTIFESIKKLYSIRSKAVHGGTIKNPQESVIESAMILRRLIVKCAEHEALPDTACLAP
jgi:hypothetical protein